MGVHLPRTIRWCSRVPRVRLHRSYPPFPSLRRHSRRLFASDRVDNMSDEAKLLTLTRKLLHSIAESDFSTYALLCSEDMTCFEPETKGTLVEGQDFHKWYFDQHGNSSRTPPKQNMCQPKVVVDRDTIASQKSVIVCRSACWDLKQQW